ncbi:hypothetical protein Nhal_0992 [Nitrosococcus halophilus Nc 4]|uniref:KilA-N DNA-binding domain-containing protein n=1 Tax=Nitrosococcus halophilus (strain Nc4) TaxID=472759 RepID=D5BYV2_NITHN|nr:ORF6N domain-containing protein [Nitrosococcus halophilus]ADE14165.1 hypothetical protein Nhal_0992 [Nitrosococcus halophilus Nc 4]
MNTIAPITINNTPLSPIVFNNTPVITLAMMDKVHERPEGTARRNFNTNKDKLIEREDYFHVTRKTPMPEKRTLDEIRTLGIPPKGIILLTESGYLLLVKSFTDDLAWKVQRQLVNGYFKAIGRDNLNTEQEPPHLPYATKEQREPLIKAVRRLVSVSNAKGRPLTHEDAHSIINLKMGVDSVEALTLEQIPKAMTLVGEILERVVLEGEYIGKDDAPYPDPECYLSPAQRLELDQAIKHALTGLWDECSDETGRQWVCNRLRVMLHLRRIEDMHPDQLPLALAELERLKQDLSAFFEFRAKERRFLCREIIGAGTPWTPHLAKQWKAELKQTVPPRPDWLAMREKLLRQAEDN